MNSLLNKYFSINHKLYIPGVGNFTYAEKPAVLDFANKSISQPQYEIVFHQENLPADKNFFNFLCAQMHTEEWKAVIAFNDFSNHIKNVLSHTGIFNIDGLGTISQKMAGELSFQPYINKTKLFPEITAERVIRKKTEHAVLVGEQEKTSSQMQHQIELQHEEESAAELTTERWWISAIVLAAIGIAAIAYYYWG